MKPALLLLGFGQTARAVLSAVEAVPKVYATTRNPMRIFELQEAGVEPIIMPLPSAEIIEPLAAGNNVLVSFAPDGSTDSILAPACNQANAIIYISSTSVYGNYRGEVTDDTPAIPSDDSARLRLEAEDLWRRQGATVLRSPAIYGPDRGLHTHLLNNTYTIPGDGSGVVSRIHVHDLAQFVLAAWSKQLQGETFVVGDLAPVPQLEVVSWLCDRLGIQLPRFAPLDAVSPTLRGNRLVKPQRALNEMAVTLKFPTYKEGFEQCLNHNGALNPST